MEISAKEYDEKINYSLPINKYIIDSFDDNNGEIRIENKYFIFSPDKNSSEIFFEINTEYDDIELNFSNGLITDFYNEAGFKKYKVKKMDDGEYLLHFNVSNINKKNTTYVIKYSYYDINTTNYFIIYDNYTINNKTNTNNDIVDISIIFDNINVYNSSKEEGIYFIITGTLYKNNETQDKTFNDKYILNEKESTNKNMTIIFYNSSIEDVRSLEFKGIPRNDYYLQLKIDVFLLQYFLNEEFLVYITKINLAEKEELNQDNNIWNWIIISIVIIAIIFFAIFFLIKFIKLKKNNDTLLQ